MWFESLIIVICVFAMFVLQFCVLFIKVVMLTKNLSLYIKRDTFIILLYNKFRKSKKEKKFFVMKLVTFITEEECGFKHRNVHIYVLSLQFIALYRNGETFICSTSLLCASSDLYFQEMFVYLRLGRGQKTFAKKKQSCFL